MRPGQVFIACVLATATTLPASAADVPLGRLFFTPNQRASLDVARTQRARTALSTEKSDEVTAAPIPQTLTYDGAVRRSDGKSTAFVNGRPVNEKESVGGAAIVGRVRPDGGISLQMPQSGRSVDLKPGQSVELLSGSVEEGLTRKPVQPESKPETKGPGNAKTDKPAAGERSSSEPGRDDQQRKVEEAMRALREAANARPGTTAAPPQGNTAPPPKAN
jgi:hypothetical protein